MKRLFLLFFLLLPALARAQFTYVTNDDNTITITGYTGSDNNVVIPDNIGGFSVSSIGGSAFLESSVASVVIPNGVTSIQDFAFENCSNLANITIDNGVTSIDDGAFAFCTSLTNIILPDNVTNIGQMTFYYCTNLESIAIPDNVSTIQNFTFFSCLNLTNVIIPNSVTSILNSAFFDCVSLTQVSIPTNVAYIISGVFGECTNLAAINVQPGSMFFKSCSGVLFDPGLTTVFLCPPGRVGSYTIPNSVTNISGSAFYQCIRLTNIVIPDSVTSIGDSAFYDCSSLKSVHIGNSVTAVGGYVFNDCYSLASISIPSSMTSIGFYMFSDCIGLTNATIPDSVTNIESGAFQDCLSLTSITIPESVNSISDQAFSGCTTLNQIFAAGNAPAFYDDYTFSFTPATIYYLPGTTGWSHYSTYEGVPIAPWYLPNPSILTFEPTFGIQTNAFGFTISWATNVPVIVDACTNLSTPNWQPVQTNTLTAGAAYFSDPSWASYPNRFYRLRSP